jgi:hypothetical protein
MGPVAERLVPGVAAAAEPEFVFAFDVELLAFVVDDAGRALNEQ